MEKKHGFIDELKENFHKGYQQGHIRTLHLAVDEGAITEEKAAEKAKLSVEEFREQVTLLEEK